MPQILLCSDLSQLPHVSVGHFILVTVDQISSKVLSSWLKDNYNVDVTSNASRKRKSPSDIVFHAEYMEDSQSQALLAKDDLSLSLKEIPTMKKSIIGYICEQIHEDTLLCFYSSSEKYLSVAGCIALIISICLKDTVLSHYVTDDNENAIFTDFQFGNDQANCVSLSFSMPLSPIVNTQRREDFHSTVAKVITVLAQKLPFLQLTKEAMQFMQRIIFATVRDKHYSSGLKRLHQDVNAQLASVEGISSPHMTESVKRLASQPPVGSGWRVFEFFSGIGGMRLGLPEQIQGKPITSITAFDCSTIANQVYEYNFHHRPDLSQSSQYIRDSKLRTCLVQHLSVSDVDNQADIWTMSPPCQPFTRTRGANQLDDADNRSQGLYHLMTLLLKMKSMPRFILVENVQWFLHSNMHKLWCQVLTKCQYRFRECLLSPEKTVGLPNSRTRYYCLARFDVNYHTNTIPRDISRARNSNQSEVKAEGKEDELQFMQHEYQIGAPVELNDDENDCEEEAEETAVIDNNKNSFEDGCICASYLLNAVSGDTEVEDNSIEVMSLGDVLGEKYSSINSSAEILSQLIVSQSILKSSWASKMLSVVTLNDKLTYCFTKGYGKRVDHSAGSCFYLGDKELDRNNLPEHFGELRLFHPEELLLLFGFPKEFKYPVSLNLQHRWGCIGNSVNVAVVKLVMRCLFEDAIWNRLMME